MPKEQNTPPPLKDWKDLNDREKLDRLTLLLTEAGNDIDCRDECLVSMESARNAVRDYAGINLPDEMEVQFLTPDEADKKLIFIMPDFVPGPEPIERKAELFMPCTYTTWAPHGDEILEQRKARPRR